MYKTLWFLGVFAVLSGCQTVNQERSSSDSREYLYDSGSLRAARLAEERKAEQQAANPEPDPSPELDQTDEDDEVSQPRYLYDSGSLKAAQVLQGQQEGVTEEAMTETEGALATLQPVTPHHVLLIEGSELTYDPQYFRHPEVLKLSNGKVLDASKWDGFLKDLVVQMPPQDRGPFLDGITRHTTYYDRVERRIAFGPYNTKQSRYTRHSHLAFVGIIPNPDSIVSLLRVRYYGDSWIFADRLTIRADDELFRFDEQAFDRDNRDGRVWETTFLSLDTPGNREVIEKIVASDESIVRMSGERSSDFVVTDLMKEDLGAMLVAIDALSN